MIIFGYKSKFSSLLRALACIAIGLVMIIGNNATETVVKIIAAFLFAAGVVSLAHSYTRRTDGSFTLMAMNGLVDIIIGLVLFFCPGFVAGFIVTLIAICLLFLGVMQLLALNSVMTLMGGGYMSLFFTIMTIILGVILLFNPFSEAVMRIMAGVALIIYGCRELRSAWKVDKAVRDYEIHIEKENGNISSASPYGDVKDAEYTKSDER